MEQEQALVLAASIMDLTYPFYMVLSSNYPSTRVPKCNIFVTDCVNNTFLSLRMHDSQNGDQIFSDFFSTGKITLLQCVKSIMLTF